MIPSMKTLMLLALGLAGCASVVSEPVQGTGGGGPVLVAEACVEGSTCASNEDCGEGERCWIIGCPANGSWCLSGACPDDCAPVARCMVTELHTGLLCVADDGCIPAHAAADIDYCPEAGQGTL